MDALYERSMLGAIECHKLFGEFRKAHLLMKEFNREKLKSQKHNVEDYVNYQAFEGTLVATGWDKLDHVIQSSLYTRDEEDILLEHKQGIKKFEPFLNQRVRVWGKIISNVIDERRICVTKIRKVIDD